MGRPRGSTSPNSLRSRIRMLLDDGVPRSVSDIADALDVESRRVRTAVHSGITDGQLKSAHVYMLAGKVLAHAPRRRWFDV